MANKPRADFEVADVSNYMYSGVSSGDLVVKMTAANAGFHVGNSNKRLLSITDSNIIISGDILPSQTLIQNIGASNSRIKNLWVDTIYLGSNTLYIGDTPVLGTNQNTIQIAADPDQGVTMKTSGTGITTVTSTAGVNVNASGLNAQVQVQSTGTGGRVVMGAASEVSISAPTFTVGGNSVMNGNMTVNGNVTVAGSNFVANVETVEIKDNILVLNKGQTGSGVSAGKAGIAIDRGDVSRYELVFEEATQSFRMGAVGATEVIASQLWTCNNYAGIATVGVAISASNRAFGSLALTGGTLTGTLTGTTINATTLQQGGTAVNSLFAPLETSNVAYGASNTAQTALTTAQSASNVAISASNRAFGSLALTGGTLTGTLTGTTINATTLQQGGTAVNSLFAAASHNHDASTITSGKLNMSRFALPVVTLPGVGSQSIGNNSFIKVTAFSGNYDGGQTYYSTSISYTASNARFTNNNGVPIVCLVTGSFTWDIATGTNPNNEKTIFLRIDGSTSKSFLNSRTFANGGNTNICGLIYLPAGSFFEVWSYQYTNANLNLTPLYLQIMVTGHE